MPGLFDLTRDLCEGSEPGTATYEFGKTLLSNLHPQLWAASEKLLQPCPYKVIIKKGTIIFYFIFNG
jgi:hypothetical protein